VIRRLETLVRYYAVGAINTAFGYGLYAALVFVGVNLYIAQLIAHVCGTTFNYFTYSRHVFRDGARRPAHFVGAYVFNYLMGLGLLATAHHFIANPYLAMLVALFVGTALNYFVLRRIVFRPPAPSDHPPTTSP
jgi:putative flippase GtrA